MKLYAGLLQHLFELAHGGAQNPRQVGQRGRVRILEVRFVALGQNPGLEGKARRVGREHGEAVGLADQAHAGGGFVVDDVAEDAALLQIVEMSLAASTSSLTRLGMTGSAINWECGCSSEAPAASPWFLNRRM